MVSLWRAITASNPCAIAGAAAFFADRVLLSPAGGAAEAITAPARAAVPAAARIIIRFMALSYVCSKSFLTLTDTDFAELDVAKNMQREGHERYVKMVERSVTYVTRKIPT